MNSSLYIGRTIKLFNSATYLIRTIPLRTSPPDPFVSLFYCSRTFWPSIVASLNAENQKEIFLQRFKLNLDYTTERLTVLQFWCSYPRSCHYNIITLN